MTKSIFRSLMAFFVIPIVLLCGLSCSKGTQIVELPIGLFTFTTFTVDTFRFKVEFNNVLITDSLLSPTFSLTSRIELPDTKGSLKVTDLKTNVIYVDTVIKTEIGPNSISIVQFGSGIKPTLAPIPSEAAPAVGNCKVRFTYVQPLSPVVPFFDSIQCLIRNNQLGSTPFDTIILRKYESSEYYEARIGSRFSMIMYNPADGSLIHNGSSASLNTSTLSGFSTAVFFGTSIGGIAGTFNYQIRKAY